MSSRFRLLVFIGSVISSGCVMDSCKNPLVPASTDGSSEIRSGPEIWIGPNVASVDYIKMFTDKELWPETFNIISTFQFYSYHLMDGCGQYCGDNSLDNFRRVEAFRWLTQNGKGISFEAGSLKHAEHGCDASVSRLARDAVRAIQNVQANGGTVTAISQDWPFYSGELCGYTIDKSAKLVGDYVNIIHGSYSGVEVGLIDGYPGHSFKDIVNIVNSLEENNIKIPFLHLDFDRRGIQRPGPDPESRFGFNPDEDFPKMRDYLRNKGIVFGIVIWADGSGSSEEFISDSIISVRIVQNAVGNNIDRLIFQSWAHAPVTSAKLYPDNLPETKPGTLTWLTNTEGRKFR